MERSIILNDLKNPSDLFRLRDYLRELFELLDRRHIVKAFSATPEFDMDLAESYSITMTANITGVTLKNPAKGRTITLIFIQGSTGSYTVAFTTTVLRTGGAFVPTTTIGAASAITFLYDGTSFYEIARSLDVR